MTHNHVAHTHVRLPHHHLPHHHRETADYCHMEPEDGASDAGIVVEPVGGSSTSIADHSETDYASSVAMTLGSSTCVTLSSTSVDSGVSIDRGHCALPQAAGSQLQRLKTHSAVELDDADGEFDGRNVAEHAPSSYSGCCSCCCRGLALECRTVIEKGRGAAVEAAEIVDKMELRRRTRQLISLQTIKDRLPITKWMPEYRYGGG